jgi:hypothetical protein
MAQLEDNLTALDFEVPDDVHAELDVASALERQFPYFFFESLVQGRIHGGAVPGAGGGGRRSSSVAAAPR